MLLHPAVAIGFRRNWFQFLSLLLFLNQPYGAPSEVLCSEVWVPVLQALLRAKLGSTALLGSLGPTV